MSAINQLILISSNYLVGMFFVPILFPEFSNRLKCLISPFVGIAIWGISVGIIYSAGLTVNLKVLLLTIALIWFLTLQIRFRAQDTQTIKEFIFDVWKVIITKENLIFFCIFSLAGLFFIISGIARVNPDSTQFEGVGRFLAQGGNINSEVRELAFLISGRFLIVGAMHAVNRLFGGYSLYALNPTISYWFLLFTVFLLANLLNSQSKGLKMSLLLLFIFSLGFNKNFLNASFFIHSNAFALVYFCSAIISLYMYSKSKINSWIYFGSFMLGIATLVRVDMLIFSLIYYSLLAKIIDDNPTLWRNSWIIFLVISIPWRIVTLHLIPGKHWYVGANWILFLLLCNIIFAIVTNILLHFRKSIRWILKATLISSILFFALLRISLPSEFNLGWKVFIVHILFGNVWISTAISVLVIVAVTLITKKIDKDYDIFTNSIVLYLFLLFFVVAFGGYEKEDHSAMRMMHHIFPIVVLSLFIGLSNILCHSLDKLRLVTKGLS